MPVQQLDVVAMMRLQTADMCGGGVPVLGRKACILRYLEPFQWLMGYSDPRNPTSDLLHGRLFKIQKRHSL